jgi:pimeloyl-ACP methyl ester carboxylesterase
MASRTFVLIHGAFHGGWCWVRVADRLRAAGHVVFTPTQTGLGERRHLLSRAITLDTFTADIANLLISEELDDVVMVGHSFGGNTTSGVADQMPERIRHLVYLDAMITQGGMSPFDGLSPETVAARRKAAESSGGLSMAPPHASAFGVFAADDVAWLGRCMTPQPLSAYESKLNLNGPIGSSLPCTYIACTDPYYEPLSSSRKWAQAQPGWDWKEIATGHDAMVSAPDELTRMLTGIAG